jgi:hypothetical protein
MRSIVLIASLVFTLVSGCLPCSQLLQQLSNTKSCCTKSGSCKIPKPPTQQKCRLTISATEHAVVPEHTQVTPAPKNALLETFDLAAINVISPVAVRPEYSPPDLFVLHSAILI